MKKLVLFCAVAAAVSFAACNNKPATEATEETVAVEEVVACDSCTTACDSCATVAYDSCQTKAACDTCAVVAE